MRYLAQRYKYGMREEKRIYSHKNTNMKYVGVDRGAHFINFPNETT